jgi:hypothetical protein
MVYLSDCGLFADGLDKPQTQVPLGMRHHNMALVRRVLENVV